MRSMTCSMPCRVGVGTRFSWRRLADRGATRVSPSRSRWHVRDCSTVPEIWHPQSGPSGGETARQIDEMASGDGQPSTGGDAQHALSPGADQQLKFQGVPFFLAAVPSALILLGRSHGTSESIHCNDAVDELRFLKHASSGPAQWQSGPLPHVAPYGVRHWHARPNRRRDVQTCGTRARTPRSSAVVELR